MEGEARSMLGLILFFNTGWVHSYDYKTNSIKQKSKCPAPWRTVLHNWERRRLSSWRSLEGCENYQDKEVKPGKEHLLPLTVLALCIDKLLCLFRYEMAIPVWGIWALFVELRMVLWLRWYSKFGIFLEFGLSLVESDSFLESDDSRPNEYSHNQHQIHYWSQSWVEYDSDVSSQKWRR